MSVPRLVATDLDGTLLRSDGTVSERTRRVLADLDARAVCVVFVTGRPIRWMEQLWEHVGAHGLAVCSNGAVVYDVPRRRVRESRLIETAVLLEVCEALRQAAPGTTFALEGLEGFAKEELFAERHRVPEGARVGAVADIADGPVVKLLARHEELAPEEFWALAERTVGTRVVTTWSSSSALVEISAAGVTKATTLALLCEELGIDAADVVAFGDMPNDAAMLAWAGTSYAMAGAHPSLLEVTDRQAPANDEDGVAAVLESLFGLDSAPPSDPPGSG